MIGVFDSGMGGLVTLGYLQEELPQHDFLTLGDTKYLPYGEKSQKFIHDRTFSCLEWMFAQGCRLVILACNTASAYTIREWQEKYPEKKVLSVTIPGVEAVVENGLQRPLLFATKATIESGIYQSVAQRLYPKNDIEFSTLIGEGVVREIESQSKNLHAHLEDLFSEIDHKKIDSVILGCTHYPLIVDQIKVFLGEELYYIDPGRESAKKLVTYIQNHSELGIRVSIKKPPVCRRFVTSNASYDGEFEVVDI